MHVPPFHGQIGFHAHHSPMGAYFTFTCGHMGSRGGLAAQLGKPANQDLYIGVKEGGRFDSAAIRCLPFFDGARAFMTEPGANFVLEKASDNPQAMSAYGMKEISRQYGWATDAWRTKDFEFSIYSPFGEIPEPGRSSSAAMRAALLPAVTAELVIDNSKGTGPKTGFFAINFNEGGARIVDEGLAAGRVGFALRSQLGVAGEAVEIKADGARLDSEESGIEPFLFMRWNVQEGLEERNNPVHLLGITPGIGVEVPAGRRVVLRLALGCYVDGVVTTRLEGRYLYTRYFTSLPDVLNEALTYHRFVTVECNTLNDHLLNSGLNRDQQFLVAHATRSYYGNTQLLEVAGQPYWIVNEGEYCMINTLDLSVDQMFWELEWNPWVVRNLLENFVRYYSYHDEVKVPSDGGVRKAAGGISFCHDQGVQNQFSPFGQSSYELRELTGCFSFMTQEQLCNWVLLAGGYAERTGDKAWVASQRHVLGACLESMVAREAAGGAGERNGLMNFDSARCGGGQEITTFDSLDASLGQARGNLYIAVKRWASFIALSRLLGMAGEEGRRRGAVEGAEAVQRTLSREWAAAQRRGVGYLPAIFDVESAGHAARILSAVEPLVYTRGLGKDDALSAGFSEMRGVLRGHLQALLADREFRNHFPDGGVRLSSTSDNSWLSKIAIVQQVAREQFGMDEHGQPLGERRGASGWERADAAHVRWLTEGDSAVWAASDQIVNGVARGSKYYPRLITTALWLKQVRPQG